MYWQYRTMLFEYQKDGLLGDKYIDDEEMEDILNEQGAQGWELVSVTPVQEGLLAFFKQVHLQQRKQPSTKEVPAEPDKTVQHKVPAPPLQKSVKPAEPIRREQEQKIVTPPKKTDAVGEIKIS